MSQYQRLKHKISSEEYSSLSKEEKALNRNYNYAWQTVVANNPWPTNDDPMYNPNLVALAERIFRRKLGKPEPDLPEPAVHSDEEIAHVAACAKLIRLYLDHGEVRRRAAFYGNPVPAPLPLIRTEVMPGPELEANITALGEAEIV